jgi:hypothetical protein
VRHQPVHARGVPVVELAQCGHILPRNALQQVFGGRFFVHCRASLIAHWEIHLIGEARVDPAMPYYIAS